MDAPEIVRTVVNFKRLTLTDIKIDVRRLAKKKELKEAIEAGGKKARLPLVHLLQSWTCWCISEMVMLEMVDSLRNSRRATFKHF